MKFPILFPFALMGVLTLASCSQDSDEDVHRALSETESLSRSVDAAVEDFADEVVFRSDSDDVGLSSCVDVSDSGPGIYPRLISLDFGDGCTDYLGRTRTGLMHIALSAPWEEIGSTRTLTFENFTVTRPMQSTAIAVEGVRTLERLEPGAEGESRWMRSLNTTLTHPEFVMDRTFNGVRRWIQGEGDSTVANVFGLTGSGTITRNEFVRNRTILEELILDKECGEIVSGTVEIERPALGEAVLDYGAGACDGQATLTSDGETYIIDL